jgi:hypothetical protein
MSAFRCNRREHVGGDKRPFSRISRRQVRLLGYQVIDVLAGNHLAVRQPARCDAKLAWGSRVCCLGYGPAIGRRHLMALPLGMEDSTAWPMQ